MLQTLPDKQRLPIEYVKLEGLSVVETARLTGLSESAVKVGVHRGLKALAARIRDMAYAQKGAGKPPGTAGRSVLPPDARKAQEK